jgi:hypothetical protein
MLWNSWLPILAAIALKWRPDFLHRDREGGCLGALDVVGSSSVNVPRDEEFEHLTAVVGLSEGHLFEDYSRSLASVAFAASSFGPGPNPA